MPTVLRRASCLIGYWDGREFVLENYLTGRQAGVSPPVLGVLNALTPYSPLTQVERALSPVHGLLDKLLSADLLLREGSPEDDADRALTNSWPWGHDARFFHFSTQATSFQDPSSEVASLAALAAECPAPAPSRDYGDYPFGLPRPEPPAEDLWGTLRSRRTRRNFSGRPLSLWQLSALLLWTWGCTDEVVDPVIGRYFLKTSPSGGARHPIEVYPLVLATDSLDPGFYHYCPRRHALSLLRSGSFPDLAVALCGDQSWVANAGSLFLMTAVLERSMWKYRSSHAYRVLLLDAGHLGQTFHLVCTALNLAPFTSAAMDGRAVEQELGVDGISEVALYVAAAGLVVDPEPPLQ